MYHIIWGAFQECGKREDTDSDTAEAAIGSPDSTETDSCLATSSCTASAAHHSTSLTPSSTQHDTFFKNLIIK